MAILKACVMGNPMKHSLSPDIYCQFAAQFNLPIDFQIIEPPLNQFNAFVVAFKKTGAQGMVVSAPFKQEAFEMADDVSDRARVAQSANIFLFRHDGTIYADNSDGLGLVSDIVKNHHYDIKNKRVLLLGAGGAARGILLSLLEACPAEIFIANRTLKKAKQLERAFTPFGLVHGVSYEALANKTVDLIIDCTSCVDESLPLPNSLNLSENSFCYDIKYSTSDLPFLLWASAKGSKKVANGLGMLIGQAVLPFELWTGETPDPAMVKFE